jgi:IS5 family transposase
MKAVGHLGPCYLKGRAGDAVNVILSAVDYNLRLMDHFARHPTRATPEQFGQPSNRLLNGRLSSNINA